MVATRVVPRQNVIRLKFGNVSYCAVGFIHD
jgi:hypothetical protein